MKRWGLLDSKAPVDRCIVEQWLSIYLNDNNLISSLYDGYKKGGVYHLSLTGGSCGIRGEKNLK